MVVDELLHYGDEAVKAVEAQLLSYFTGWLQGAEGPAKQALALQATTSILNHCNKEVAKKYAPPLLPLLSPAIVSEEPKLRRAAAEVRARRRRRSSCSSSSSSPLVLLFTPSRP